jgi:hypothetical protein
MRLYIINELQRLPYFDIIFRIINKLKYVIRKRIIYFIVLQFTSHVYLLLII